MLIGQAGINLAANILSALQGLLSVFAFARLLSPHDYGTYLLGLGLIVALHCPTGFPLFDNSRGAGRLKS
jgi:O-antigen/teichoic acid export membrane protein